MNTARLTNAPKTREQLLADAGDHYDYDALQTPNNNDDDNDYNNYDYNNYDYDNNEYNDNDYNHDFDDNEDRHLFIRAPVNLSLIHISEPTRPN